MPAEQSSRKRWVDGCPLAAGRRPRLVALHVEHHPGPSLGDDGLLGRRRAARRCRRAPTEKSCSWPRTAPARWSIGSTATRIVGSTPVDPEQLMERMTADLDPVAPSEFATFQKSARRAAGCGSATSTSSACRARGTGRSGSSPSTRPPSASPPCPAISRPARSSSGSVAGYRSLCFEIESWARSGDRLSDLLYTRLRISKEVQLHMWSSVLRRVVGLAEGKMEGGIVITTRRVDPEALPRPDADEPPAPSGAERARGPRPGGGRTSTPRASRTAPTSAAGATTTWSRRCPREASGPAGRRRQLAGRPRDRWTATSWPTRRSSPPFTTPRRR